ncbi:hypothetical protein PV343_01380 [Streptomyces sp. WI03-4A]|uniref:hypothetical protein n=1 Tax=Streptomyces sp. WI03-4A TaxID=3028706 RepID=UPI0029A4FB62|nr:hypothetical protein [Streptomyces sp. WI03-4A]MDX2590976.1 hypothetical protein [Streptomyces sp. WI03-4A]
MAKNETVETVADLADALGGVDETDPTVATIEQIHANIERAVSLAEAENTEGLAELNKETEALISGLPSRGKTPDGTTFAKFKQESRNAFREASQAKPKPEAAKAVAVKEEAPPTVQNDYTLTEGVKEIVDNGANLVAEGVRLHVKTAQTARQIAESLLDTRRRIITADGVPDLKSITQASRNASADMYGAAREALAKESGDAEHAKALVGKIQTAVNNQMSDVLVGYVRALDENPDEFNTHFGKIAEAHPELSPAEAVFTFYDIPRKSKREIMAERQRAKADKLKELEAKAEEGDEQAAEAAEELKTATVQEKVAGDVQAADKALRRALATAKELSDSDKVALKAKIMEWVALANEL